MKFKLLFLFLFLLLIPICFPNVQTNTGSTSTVQTNSNNKLQNITNNYYLINETYNVTNNITNNITTTLNKNTTIIYNYTTNMSVSDIKGLGFNLTSELQTLFFGYNVNTLNYFYNKTDIDNFGFLKTDDVCIEGDKCGYFYDCSQITDLEGGCLGGYDLISSRQGNDTLLQSNINSVNLSMTNNISTLNTNIGTAITTNISLLNTSLINSLTGNVSALNTSLVNAINENASLKVNLTGNWNNSGYNGTFDNIFAKISYTYIQSPPWISSYTETDPIWVAASSSYSTTATVQGFISTAMTGNVSMLNTAIIANRTVLNANITALINNNTRQDINLTSVWGNITSINTNLTSVWGNFSLYSTTALDTISDAANISKYMTNNSPIFASTINETTLIIPINNINKSKACSPQGNLSGNSTGALFFCIGTAWKTVVLS